MKYTINDNKGNVVFSIESTNGSITKDSFDVAKEFVKTLTDKMNKFVSEISPKIKEIKSIKPVTTKVDDKDTYDWGTRGVENFWEDFEIEVKKEIIPGPGKGEIDYEWDWIYKIATNLVKMLKEDMIKLPTVKDIKLGNADIDVIESGKYLIPIEVYVNF